MEGHGFDNDVQYSQSVLSLSERNVLERVELFLVRAQEQGVLLHRIGVEPAGARRRPAFRTGLGWWIGSTDLHRGSGSM